MRDRLNSGRGITNAVYQVCSSSFSRMYNLDFSLQIGLTDGCSRVRFVQMIGGFIHPGKPMANMYVLSCHRLLLHSLTKNDMFRYFVLYSYNSVIQAQLLMRDLKIAQCTCSPCFLIRKIQLITLHVADKMPSYPLDRLFRPRFLELF